MFLLFFTGETILAHPVHVSIANLEFTETDTVITIKLFKDDLQLAVYHNYAVEIPLDKIGDETYMEFILTYIREKFSITYNNNEKLRIDFVSSETNEEAIWLYFIPEGLPSASNIYVFNSIFLDIYFDQTNLLIFNHNGNQKGYRFDMAVTEMEILL